jgi:hypothetical protein
MSTNIGSNRISEEDLQLFFDGELTGAEAQELAAQIDAQPELRRELEQLGFVRDLVAASLEAKAKEIPEARFEQVWDEIDRAIESDARGRTAGQSASIWARLRAAFGSARVPILATAGAAAVVLILVQSLGGTTDDANKADEVASVEHSGAKEPTPPSESSEPMPPLDAIAAAPTSPEAEAHFPEPRPAEADIHSIEFGGKNGRITRTGTVTVLYVEEDLEDENDSERSL